jgi:serine protease Do
MKVDWQMQTVTRKIGFSLLAIALAGVLAGTKGLSQTTAPQRGRSATSRTMMRRGYLGVGVMDVTPERAKALNRKEEGGVEVKHVDENSPASKAGLRENDIILEVNKVKVDDVDQFVRTISESAPGTKIDLSVWRNSARQNLAATLEAHNISMDNFDPDFPMPPMPPMPPLGTVDGPVFVVQAPIIGFEGETLTSQLAEFFGVKSGVLVRSVTAGTPAAKAGLKAGDVVTKVNAVTVTNPREVQALVRMSRRRTIPFAVVRDKKEMSIDLEAAQ